MSGGREEDGERRGEINASRCRLIIMVYFLVGWPLTNTDYV